MKKYLTEKNLMWAVIAVLAVVCLSSCTSECCGDQARFQKGGKAKMAMVKDGMRERMQGRKRGSKGDTGRGAWVTREALVDGEKKGRRRGPKEAR
tara:strand:+ start:872 stop:1156 length:285 start_codon:yes stop_codon:yes gene_type:complete